MKSQLINKSLFEVHKPSGQISSKLTKNGILYQLTPIQFDTINFMCYTAREQMHKTYGSEKELRKIISDLSSDDDIFNFLSNQEFEINLNDIAQFTGSYKSAKNKVLLSRAIKELKDITVEMGLFKQHDLSSEETFSLLRRYSRTTNSTKVKFRLEPEILIGWVFKTTPFSKLFLKIQTHLKNTYSKILYENCKDYEKIGVITKPLKLWNYILGINTQSSAYVSTLKRDYLNKAIKEINEHTDIFIDKIYGKKKDGIINMTVEFHKQKCDLIDNQEPELSIEEQIKYNKKKSIAEQRLEQAKQFQEIKNEDAWIKKTIESITDEFLEQQDLIESAKEQIDNINIKDYADKLSIKYGDIIGLDKYKLFYIFDESKPSITNNAKETLDILSNL